LSTTHTRTEANPWWEVKLADTLPIEQVVVWNRTDGNLGDRLKGYTVRILDSAKKDVFLKEKNPTRSLTPILLRYGMDWAIWKKLFIISTSVLISEWGRWFIFLNILPIKK
jgi:hypothetical protein